jgi:outer membrane protein OmpA-like peptidoglycan-associated protein
MLAAKMTRMEDEMKTSNIVRTAMARSGLLATLFATATVLIASGCTTTDAYTGEKKVNNASKGAGIGALAGAAIGALSGDNSKERRERALIGAGVGALTGAGVGAYMDKQEAKLRAQLQGTGVSVTRSGDNLILNMPGNITFQTASADLNSSFYKVLDSVGLVLKEFDKTLIDVEGHTDSDGSDEYNQQLSLNRANSVGSYLQSHGVNQQRIVALGAGETRPVAPNTTAAGKQQNRLVELRLQPIVRG